MGFPQLRSKGQLRVANEYRLTGDVGSYSATGGTTGLRKTSIVSASSGSYSYTGAAASLITGPHVTAASGSYTYTGSDTILSYTLGIAPALSFSEYKRKNYPRAFHPSLRQPFRPANGVNNYVWPVDGGI